MSTYTTVQTIESKKIGIGAQERENWRIVVVLTILASEEKLAPFL